MGLLGIVRASAVILPRSDCEAPWDPCNKGRSRSTRLSWVLIGSVVMGAGSLWTIEEAAELHILEKVADLL